MNFDEYRHIDTVRLIEMKDLMDRCKCKTCQDRVKLYNDILDWRNKSHRERLNPEDFGKWIKIEDKIPLYGEKVLAFSEGAKRIYICYRVKENEYNEHWTICEDSDCSCVGCTAPISHWMCLPKYPL